MSDMPERNPDANSEPTRKGRRKFLLSAAALTAGSLLSIGCAENVASNPKGSWYDDAGSEAQDGASGDDAVAAAGDATQTTD